MIKAKIIDKIKRSLDAVDNHTFIDTYKIMAELLQEMGQDIILHKNIQALDHYLNVLPGDITTGGEQKEFETALFKILDDYNY